MDALSAPSGTDKRGILFFIFFQFRLVAELDQKTSLVAVQVLPLSSGFLLIYEGKVGHAVTKFSSS